MTIRVRVDEARLVPVDIQRRGEGLVPIAENLTGEAITSSEPTNTVELRDLPRWVSAINHWGREGRWAFQVCRNPQTLERELLSLAQATARVAIA